jgi:hypothetical protein
MADTKPCPRSTRDGRLRKAQQFLAAADLIATMAEEEEEIADAYVTLCVHAGIAAADVICCARLGKHSTGDNHAAAVSLLASVDKSAAKQLNVLLDMKARAGYSAMITSATDQKRAGRAAAALAAAAERI